MPVPSRFPRIAPTNAPFTSSSADVEFLPQEFVALDPTEGGVYEYAPGDHDRLLFRRSPTTRGLWEWSDDGKEWYSTDNYEQVGCWVGSTCQGLEGERSSE